MKAAHIKQRGFSLLEVIFTITVLSVLGAVALGVFSEVRQSTQNATLDSSVAELNKSVNSYVAFGGSVDGARTPAEVFARLKSTASAETADRIAGLSGQFLDPRLNFEFQTTEEAARPVPRAYWDPENQRFNITRRGAPGIKRFFLDDNAIPPQATEHRNPSLKLAAEDPWIWDYQDRIPAEPPAPVFIPTVPVLPGPLPASSEGYVATSTQLAPPLFSRSGGTYPVTDFPLSLSLFNPNPLGTASIYFRIDYASWQSFNGSLISILPNQLLQAQAIPVDPAAYEASVFAEELYDTNLVALALPVIDLSAPQFSLDSPTVTVEITQDDNLENSRIDYRIDGGDWTLYANPFVLNRSDHPEGAVIEAVAVATVPYYLDSSVASASIGVAARPEVFATFCGSGLADHGVTILEGGRYRTSHSGSGVDGDVAIGPGGTWSISDGAVTGVFRIHPGTSGNLGNGTDQFGSGGNPIDPVTSDLAHLQHAALAVSAQAASLPATQTFSKIDSTTTLSATAADGLNVVSVGEISLSGGSVLTLSGGPEDYFIVNISKGVKMSGGSTWTLAGGLKSSNVLFNLLPGASEFGGSGSSEFSSAAIILAPHPGTKVVITGSSAIVGNVITATEFTATGGSRVLGASCK